MKKLFCIIFSLASTVHTQNKISVHQSESDYYSQAGAYRIENIIPQPGKNFASHSAASLKKTVFGFLPDWEYYAGTYSNLRYDLISHVAVAFFKTDGEGNLSDPPYWPWTPVISKARANNVKLILSVSNFNSDQIHKLLSVTQSRDKFFAAVSDKIKNYSFAGVNIDFENLLTQDRGTPLINFMKSLSDYLKPLYSSEISFDTPAVNDGGWDFAALSNSCDYLFVMGYDYYGSWSSTTGPSAPLTGASRSITYSLDHYYNNVSPEKLILGVPYYGNYWRTNSGDPYAPVVPYDTAKSNNDWVKPALYYRDIISQYSSHGKLLDAVSGTPWLRWHDTRWNQIWYDDQNSLADKLNFALSKNLKGIGIWALGYDNGRPELWNVIESKLVTNAEEDVNSLPQNLFLHQNYPNPFNLSTTITYELPNAAFVSLRVFDELGREVSLLVNGFQQSGIHKLEYKIGNKSSSSGIYYYILSDGNVRLTKKMIFLK